jgi:hypothetical protein
MSGSTMTGTIAMLSSAADSSACLVTGNAMLTDSGGAYNPNFISMGVSATPLFSATWSYNFAKSYFVANDTTPSYGFRQCPGSASHHCTWTNNILDGFNQPYGLPPSYGDLSGNICYSHAQVGAEQGCFFGFGDLNDTSTNDMILAGNQALGYFTLGNSTVASSTVITNPTIIKSLSDVVNTLMAFGEAGSGLNVTASSVENGIMVGGLFGIVSGNSTDAFLTTGTGGVGVSGNDVFGTNSSAYALISGATNFDNGTTPHPSSTYGDVSVAPGFVSVARTWATCDQILGGPGTTADLFTQLFNRWNGTNAVQFTPAGIYNCMKMAFAPTNIALVGKGAVTPVLASFMATQ